MWHNNLCGVAANFLNNLLQLHDYLLLKSMVEDYQMYHVRVETFPVDQQGVSWLS